MISIGDIVEIHGLTSEQGTKLNKNYAKVTSVVQNRGRCGVTLFTRISGPILIPVPMEVNDAALLKSRNMRVLPKDDKSSEHMSLYLWALTASLFLNPVERFSIGNGTVKRFRQLKELRELFGRKIDVTLRIDLAHALTLSDSDEALKLFIEAFIDIKNQKYPELFNYTIKCRIDIANMLLIMNRPHQALDLMRGHADRFGGSRQIYTAIADALKCDPCGEEAYKQLVSMDENDAQTHANLGSFYGRCGRFDDALIHLRKGLGKCGANEVLKNMIRASIDLCNRMKSAMPNDVVNDGTNAFRRNVMNCTRAGEPVFALSD